MTFGKRFRSSIEGYLFISPAILVIGLFGIFPVFFTLYVSLHKWRMKRGRFLFFDNYQEIFGTALHIAIIVVAIVLIFFGYRLFRRNIKYSDKLVRKILAGLGILLVAAGVVGFVWVLPQIWAEGDEDMLDSMRVTAWYSLGTVPVQIIVGLLLAVLLDRKFRGKQVYRVIFLLPYIVPSVAAAAVFERLFSLRPESFANQLLKLFSAEPLQWLLEVRGVFEMIFGWGRIEQTGVVAAYWQAWVQGPSLALVSIMFFNYWVFAGYYALIFANGLSNIPRQLYEAAEVDGAKKFTVLTKIILPLLSPTTFFLTMLGIIGTFKAFNHIYVLRNVAARGAADPMSVYIFFTFFRKSRFGYAAALSLVLFIIVLGLTLFQRKVMEKRVFYGE